MKEKGPVRLFPLLYSISSFLFKDHPEYHPDTTAYQKYWEEHEKRCLEGFWALDSDGESGGWRYMPGFLYYYVNFCIIRDEDEKGNTERIITPLLRDVEWIYSYGWITARGFSGFDGDNKFTCNRIVKKIEDNKPLSPKETKLLQKHKPNLLKPDGSYKEYIEARDYIYHTFKEPLGKPLFDNEALNLLIFGSRRSAKSYFTANAIIGHEYNFYGKRFFDESYLTAPAGVEVFVGSAQGAKSAELLKKFFHTQEWIKKHFGAWGKGEEFIPGYFANDSVGKLTPNNFDSPFRHEYKYYEGNTWMVGGTGTKILHGVFTVENPQAAVGHGPTVIVIEEVGLLPNLLDVLAASETAQMRRTKFGSLILIGTAGNMEKVVESKIVFEDPESYNMLPYPDLWEGRSKPIGLFIPAYYVDTDFKDENGNTNLELAYEQELSERAKREKSDTSAALDGYIMARPIVPSEMFLTLSSTIFPTAKLRERLAYIETHDMFRIWASIGTLHYDPQERNRTVWEEDLSRRSKPITTMNLDSLQGQINGSIVVYEHPPDRIPSPTYKRSLYKISYDPLKDDGYGTSLASILVHKGYSENNWNQGTQDDIVAEYIGRYDSINDVHEIAIKLAIYYNAKVMVENNLPDFIRYCKMNGRYHLLQISPYEAISKALLNPSRKYEVGISMSKGLNIHCEQLLRQWLLESWKTLPDGKVLLNLDKIKSPRLLSELITYDRQRNFDHVSSFKLLVLWLSQEREVYMLEATDKDPKKDSLDNLFSSIMKPFGHSKRNSRKTKQPFHAF
jgi:hypothetical protein